MALKLKMDLNKIKEDIIKSETKTKSFEKDTRFWTPTVDKDKNATVLMRFLPDQNGELWSKYYSHAFNFMVDGQKKWWIRNCINTFGYDKDCPICKKNMELWNSSFESDKAIASTRKRKESYVSNVLIIQNKNKPEEEGKVFFYKFGKKIFEKIKSRIVPADKDKEDPDFLEFNPYHPLEGATFKLKCKQQGDYPNYDDSEFSICKPLFDGNEKKIQAVLDSCYDLAEFTDIKNYPTNEELVQKLGTILGISKPKIKDVKEIVEEEIDDVNDVPFDMDKTVTKDVAEETESSDEEEETDGDLLFFKSLK
jgi:hypothetical protein